MTRIPAWSSPADLKAQVQKLWDRGMLLASQVEGTPLFPLRLTLKKPDSRELSDRFAEVRQWIAQLEAAAGRYRIERRDINHRVLGPNTVPAAIWIDTLDDALALIGKRAEATRFASLVALTRATQPKLLHWLKKRPLRSLELAEHWPQLLHFVSWLAHHPRPHIYLRQVALPQIHTKLLEAHRVELAEWLDLVLPPEAVDTAHTGLGGFCQANMTQGYAVGHKRHAQVPITSLCHQFTHFARNVRELCEQLSALGFELFHPSKSRGIGSRMPKNKGSIPLFRGVGGGNGCKIGFCEGLRATARIGKATVMTVKLVVPFYPSISLDF